MIVNVVFDYDDCDLVSGGTRPEHENARAPTEPRDPIPTRAAPRRAALPRTARSLAAGQPRCVANAPHSPARDCTRRARAMATLFRSRRVVLPGGVREAGLLVDGDGRVARVLEAHELLDPAHAAGPHLQWREVEGNENSIPPTTTKANLEIKLEAAKGKRHLKDMVEAGVVGFKCFLCPTGVEEFSSASVADVEEALKELQGTKSVLAFHAEVDLPDVEPPQKDKARKYQTYLNTRPPLMEVNAIRKVAELCQQYKVRCHIVHLSAAEALPIVRNAKARGNQLTAETCHHYLSLASENIPDGATQFKCCPPIRNQKNQEHLWTALRSNVLDMVVSDHSPATADTKRLDDGNFLEAWGGIASVQFGKFVSILDCCLRTKVHSYGRCPVLMPQASKVMQFRTQERAHSGRNGCGFCHLGPRGFICGGSIGYSFQEQNNSLFE
ncbi:CAD protein [Gryllus bimaculatus]|nr:CAD protein [Gryllus bimaculatus]